LLAAVLLAEAGIKVRIIDREERTTTRSYACALHPRVLRLLDRLGVAKELLEHGQRVEKMAFYDGPDRRAEVALAQPGSPWQFLLILPQYALEEALERRLKQKAGVSVEWNHRFDTCREEDAAVLATVEELGGTSTGYIVPHWEMVVLRRAAIRAKFLIGADGHRSQLRENLELDYQPLGGAISFSAWQFKTDLPSANEARVVLDDATANEARVVLDDSTVNEARVVLDDATVNVLWPLGPNENRWTFQVTGSEFRDFPEKERRSVRIERPPLDERLRDYVAGVARERAPWYSAGVKEVTWCTGVAFQQRLVRPFGRGRCWLAGDAAHQTGPVGAQSMNVGMCEAESLAGRLEKVLRGGGSRSLLDEYDRECQWEWARLMGLSGGFKAGATASDWVRRRLGRLLPCLPGSGEDLAPLASQLGIEV
jgi:2-polyprenyl-6-methoxyphenol hydroxylase-like FAD-dependent oxidoreductase